MTAAQHRPSEANEPQLVEAVASLIEGIRRAVGSNVATVEVVEAGLARWISRAAKADRFELGLEELGPPAVTMLLTGEVATDIIPHLEENSRGAAP